MRVFAQSYRRHDIMSLASEVGSSVNFTIRPGGNRARRVSGKVLSREVSLALSRGGGHADIVD
jgi:hypothetical protein